MRDPRTWNRALTLSERDFLFSRSAPGNVDTTLAERRIAQWRRDSSLLSDARFARRLAQQGFDNERFSRLLGSPAPSPAETPSWLGELEAAYRDAGESGWPEPTDGVPEDIFRVTIQPLLDYGQRCLDQRLRSLAADGELSVDLGHFLERWSGPLPRQLLWMVTRTLLLELQIHRVEGRLEGETPEERFESFLAPLRTGAGMLELLSVYPVLGRALAARIGQWVESGAELAERLVADLPELEAVFGGPFGQLTDLSPGLSDRHGGGRSVAVLEFSNDRKVVYKPRGLALDVRFQELLGWLGDQGIEPRLRTLRVVDRGSWGWVEHVEHAPCGSAEEVDRFYARMGILMALLDVLEATDFHHENLIAAGEHPVLIDLETLFQPIFEDLEAPDEGSAPDLSLLDLPPAAASILRIGLLPMRAQGDLGGDGFDLSGLGARRGQPRPKRELHRVGTDEMGLVDGMGEIPVGQHRPTRNGEEIPLESVRGVLLESYAKAWRKLRDLRSELARPGGWLDRFADLETRFILRSTGLYDILVHFGYHPDYLGDSFHRERFLDKLWLDVERLPHLERAIPAEREDLLRGDFPRFSTRPGSRDLLTSGGERLEDFFPCSGLDLVRHRLATMDERDLERQLALARLSLESAEPIHKTSGEPPTPPAARPIRPVGAPPSRDACLAAACQVGELLEGLAMRSGGDAVWFHLRPAGDGYQVLEPVGPDLYNGLGGIALFYAHLGAVSGYSHFTGLARRALAAAQARPPGVSDGVGGFLGLGGWVYTLSSLAALWDAPELFDAAEAARDRLVPAIEADVGLDILAGSAGCLAALLALHRYRPRAATLGAARLCGEHLLDRAEAQEHGLAWRIPVSERPLAGFAHGASGMAWALASLGQATGEERFNAAARDAVAFERALFSPLYDNWPNLLMDPRPDGSQIFSHAWCHGAPGIGLSRLALLDLGQDPELETELRAAARSTLANGADARHCLCHGNLGNLELLSGAAHRLEDPELRAGASALAAHVLDNLATEGARRGLDGKVDLPGLMLGHAGIGYGLLRLAAPETVPSVLLLAAQGA